MADEKKKRDIFAGLDAKLDAPPPTPDDPGETTDPVAAGMSRASGAIERIHPGVAAFGRAVLPQSTPELAAQAGLALLSGGTSLIEQGATKVGLPWAARALGGLRAGLSERGFWPAVQRAVATGALTSGAAETTGYDPVETGVRGLLGRGTGEVLAGGLDKALQSRVVGQVTKAATEKFDAALRQILGTARDLPKTPEGLLTYVLGDKPAETISKQMRTLIEDQAGGVVLPAGPSVLPVINLAKRLDLPVARAEVPSRYAAGGQVALDVPQEGGVRLRPLWDAVQKAKQTADPGRKAELYALENALVESLSEVKPEVATAYRGLRSEWNTARGLHEYLRAGQTAEQATETLLDDQGRLSIQGLRTLVARQQGDQAALDKAIGEQNRALVGESIGVIPEMGAARPTEGTGVRLGATFHPTPRVFAHLPRPAWAPQWETQANQVMRGLATQAIPALTAAGFEKGLPVPRAAENRAEAAEPERTPPTD